MRIKKAIIPVAGLGTRFLPVTKAVNKEMLPVVDKPLVHFLVEEAVASGIEEIIFVTNRSKEAIKSYFETNPELEEQLAKTKKFEFLKKVQDIPSKIRINFVSQPEPLGDGHAILCAKEFIGNEPCAVLFGDDLVDAKIPCLTQLIKVYNKYQEPVIALCRVPKKIIHSFGVIDGVELEKGVYDVKKLVEKPSAEEAPSDLAVVGKYILTPEVFKVLEQVKPSERGEIGLAETLGEFLEQKGKIKGCQFEGKWCACGDKLGYLKSIVNYGLKDPEIGNDFSKFLKKLTY